LLEQRKFFPTDLGQLINELLVAHFPTIMDVEFTASMEQNLDKIEEGATDWIAILKAFYGPFKAALDAAKEEMKSVKLSMVPTDIPCKICGGKMVIRWGRNGEFLACETYPECKHTQDFKKDASGKILPVDRDEPELTSEICDKCGKPMAYKQGRYGKFMACSGYPECRNIKAESTGVSCPAEGCTGEIIKKISKRGKVFYACDQYPKCSFALWDRPINKPCPECNAPFLLEKVTKKSGTRLQCDNKECKYTERLEEDE
jgi:DNA topoisomerase-1